MIQEIRKTGEKIPELLRKLGIDYEVLADCFRFGSSAVLISAGGWRRNSASIKIRAIVLMDVQKTGNEAMFREYSLQNVWLPVGKIYRAPDALNQKSGSIYLETSLLAIRKPWQFWLTD